MLTTTLSAFSSVEQLSSEIGQTPSYVQYGAGQPMGSYSS